MTFQPGHTFSPGRRPGSRNKLGREFDAAFEEAKARGYTHPFLRMMEIAYDESQPTERRDTNASCSRFLCMSESRNYSTSIPIPASRSNDC